MHRRVPGAVLALLLGLAGCAAGPQRIARPETQPFAVATPQSVGIDPEPIGAALAALPPDHGLHAMLVLRRDRLVLERYWNGHDADTLQDLRSATKSITALLVGIAIDRGALPGVDADAGRWLDAAYPGLSTPGLRIADLLTMRSGRQCDDRDPASPGQEDRMYGSRDWVAYFLALPPAPGPRQTHYCTGGVIALGRVLREATGQDLEDFARTHLFEPLGIPEAHWDRFDDGRQVDSGGHLRLRARDLLRIGQLVLAGGRWGGRSIVSEDWIREATREQTTIDGGRRYGYLWWLGDRHQDGRRLRIVYASGNGGQLLFIVPALDLVVAFTGGNYNSPRAGRPFELLVHTVLPAVRAP